MAPKTPAQRSDHQRSKLVEPGATGGEPRGADDRCAGLDHFFPQITIGQACRPTLVLLVEPSFL